MASRFLLVLWLHVIACRTDAPSSIEQRFDAFVRAERTTRDLTERARFSAIATAYREMARVGKTLDRISDRDLDLLYRGAQMESYYSHDPTTIRDMVSSLDALQKRGLASSDALRAHARSVHRREDADRSTQAGKTASDA